MANDMIWAFLAHFGTRKDGQFGWEDGGRCVDNTPLRFDEDTWKEVSGRLVGTGCNMIVIDVCEFMRFDSHPELAIPGSWTKQRFAEELARLRAMGFEVIPKLNFSTSHDKWLGIYTRMVSTPQYYQVCKDVIDEVCEVFGNPRLFHLGMDEEVTWVQRPFIRVRLNELFWHDFFYLAKCVEAHGARPWMWADYVWHTPEKEKDFLENMTKDVLLSQWYYGNFKHTEGYLYDSSRAYEVLAKAGFDQLPTASNCDSTIEFCRENLELTIDHTRNLIAPENLKGYMMTTWEQTIPQRKHRLLDAVEILKEGYAHYHNG